VTGARIGLAAAVVWLEAGIGYLVLEAIAAAGFLPGYSYAHNFISDLGVPERIAVRGAVIGSQRACLMNTAFYLQGIGFLTGAILLVRSVGKPKVILFQCFAAANALGSILVGTFHSGPAAAADGTAPLHRIGRIQRLGCKPSSVTRTVAAFCT
jgi:hypothetical membrane protein